MTVKTVAQLRAAINDNFRSTHTYNESVGSRLNTALTDIVDSFESVDSDKAPLASPAFTGTPTAPTAALGTNTTQLATTAFTQAAVAALVDSSPAALDTLNELAAALGDDANYATTINNALALKAPLASPVFTTSFSYTGADAYFGDAGAYNVVHIRASSAAAARVAGRPGNMDLGGDTINFENTAGNVAYGSLSATALNLTTGRVFSIDGTQVVGPQGAAIADATDAASAITQLNLALAALRTHGLIDT